MLHLASNHTQTRIGYYSVNEYDSKQDVACDYYSWNIMSKYVREGDIISFLEPIPGEPYDISMMEVQQIYKGTSKEHELICAAVKCGRSNVGHRCGNRDLRQLGAVGECARTNARQRIGQRDGGQAASGKGLFLDRRKRSKEREGGFFFGQEAD